MKYNISHKFIALQFLASKFRRWFSNNVYSTIRIKWKFRKKQLLSLHSEILFKFKSTYFNLTFCDFLSLSLVVKLNFFSASAVPLRLHRRNCLKIVDCNIKRPEVFAKIDIGAFIEKCPIKTEEKCKKKWRWSCRKLKT